MNKTREKEIYSSCTRGSKISTYFLHPPPTPQPHVTSKLGSQLREFIRGKLAALLYLCLVSWICSFWFESNLWNWSGPTPEGRGLQVFQWKCKRVAKPEGEIYSPEGIFAGWSKFHSSSTLNWAHYDTLDKLMWKVGAMWCFPSMNYPGYHDASPENQL